MSNLHRWDVVYDGLEEPVPFGDDTSYRIAADLLASCDRIEDWGCGSGWFRRFLRSDQEYVGLDGSRSPFADRIVDLASYRSDSTGILLRHVLEHDRRWRDVLENALASVRERLVIVLFTPWAEQETELARCGRTGVPDLALPRRELLARLDGFTTTQRRVRSRTHHGAESILLVARPLATSTGTSAPPPVPSPRS